MFGRRTSRQGSETDSGGDGVDWTAVQDIVKLVQSKQQISKDTLAGFKKTLKSPSKSLVCKTLTTLDSIAANGGPAIRTQLADARWVEMLLSVCHKNPTSALPVCQLLSNWVCSYNNEQLGHAANFAAQTLKQKGYVIPPPAPLAYQMAEIAQQGTPMIGFQRGFDFTAVDLWMPPSEHGGSMGSRQGSASSRASSQSALQPGPLQVGGNISQKLQAMQHGVRQLRETDQICQSILDAGSAVTESAVSQHSQKGWHLAKKCSGWANEVQVMVACEPADNVLAALLQMNDDLLAAVSSWDNTASRLAMLQSASAASALAAGHSHGSMSSQNANVTAELSGSSSSSSSVSDRVPTPAAYGGLFWGSASANPSQPAQGSVQQQPRQQQQQQQQQQYPPIYVSNADRLRAGQPSASQTHGTEQAFGNDNGSYMDDPAHISSAHPHQSAAAASDNGSSSWNAFGAGGAMPPALPPRQGTSGRQAGPALKPEPTKEFHGTVLSYRLAEPSSGADASGQPESPLIKGITSDGVQQPAAASWLDDVSGLSAQQPASNGAVQRPFDPFSVDPFSRQHPVQMPATPFDATSHSDPPSGAFQQFNQNMSGLPRDAQEAAAMTARQDSNSSSQAGRTSMQNSFTCPSPPAQPSLSPAIAGMGSRLEPGLSTASSMGSRAPSIPLTQEPSMQSFSSLSVKPNMSTQSLTSLASGSVAASSFRSPSPGLNAAPSSSQAFDAASQETCDGPRQEVVQLRQEIQSQEAAHAEEIKQLQKEHAANVAAVQAQAVAKMKELIEKVKEQTLREREQAELRLQEAHQAEQNAMAQLQGLRKDCRDKDAAIADLRQKLSQAAGPAVQSHDFEADASTATSNRQAASSKDLTVSEQTSFGGIPRPKSASSMQQQLPSVGPSARRGRISRAGSHLDKAAASTSSLQAYYRQPALRVRFTPGQLEELSQTSDGPSHKEWSAKLKLPKLDAHPSWDTL